MPGRDITRLPNRGARVLLFTFVICAGVLMAMPAWSQSAAPQNDTKSTAPAGTPTSATPSSPATASPATSPAAQTPPTQDKPAPDKPEHDKKDEKLNDQGVFVFRKDVDEVLLHASVIDDHQHIVTNLDRGAFSVFEDGKPQNIISFHHEDIPVSIGIIIDNSGSMRESGTR